MPPPSILQFLHQFANSIFEKAKTAIEALTARKQGKELISEPEVLDQMVQAIIKKHEIAGLLQHQVTEEMRERHIRKYKDRPAGIRIDRKLVVVTIRDEAAIQKAIFRLG